MRTFALLALPLMAALILADEKKDEKKPNSLTPEEAQKGWLLLFDGETTFGWKIEGEAKVEKGVLVLGGKKETKAEPAAWLTTHRLQFETRWEGKKTPRYRLGNAEYNIDGVAGADFFATRLKCTSETAGPLVQFIVPAGSRLALRDALAKPETPKALFDGKSLDGWNVYKGDEKRQKSKFTVTREGWLNVKDGPGDLQTEKKFDDFVLQLDCISNGKHLNSGIFFRAIPGEYQQGYEAQIRNEFSEKPQKYTVEEYDPKTNKLTGKKDVMSPAIDYGTGAVYRRVPVRKQASKDGEWFTMTVVARGRHFATWVNGIQQVDWTDNRPEGKTGRVGYYGDAGCLSIQGHDPTTDLSFRNIRIAELPRAKK